MVSLWGNDIEMESTQDSISKITMKISSPKKITTTTRSNTKGMTVDERLLYVKSEVLRILGRYANDTETIYTKEDLAKYIDAAIENGIIAYDTETNNSLDPITCKIMGACLYTPGQKHAYVPINHIDVYTRQQLPNQVTEEDLAKELERLNSATKIIYHNAKFDYQVTKCTTSVQLRIDYDTLIAEKMLDENRKSYKLKTLYSELIDNTAEKYDIESLFDGLEYAIVSPEIFALYAATDSYLTYGLYENQQSRLNTAENKRLKELIYNVEIPTIKVVAEMELTGARIDVEYQKKLADKLHLEIDTIMEKINAELDKIKPDIAKWRLSIDANTRPKAQSKGKNTALPKTKNEQLPEEINIMSNQQLSIILYDVLGIQKILNKNGNPTVDEDALSQIDHPIAKLVTELRTYQKLTSTYIDNILSFINPKTDRVHTHYNQLGAKTGRMSSSEPINFQNIPSHEKSIRLLFIPDDGNLYVGADFSQQEVRLLASITNDKHMLENYDKGLDIYATVATMVYGNNYYDNLEFDANGVQNAAGAERRSNCKSIVLGTMYQRGANSIAEQIGKSKQEAQKIIDDFFNGFKGVKEWVNGTFDFVRKNGYVEDLWGRRRRLPEATLPKYDVHIKGQTVSNFNPILYCKGKYSKTTDTRITKYQEQLSKCRSKKDVTNIISKALTDNVIIVDNGGKIAQAERQAVNSPIQGSAATMTKIAMIQAFNDETLNRLGFKLVLAVHDELIGECPKENVNEVSERLREIMLHCVEDVVKCKMNCDVSVTSRWYEDSFASSIKKKYKDCIKKQNLSEEQAKEVVIKNNPMIKKEYLLQMMGGTYECGQHSDI